MYATTANSIEAKLLRHRVLDRVELDALLAKYRELADRHGPQARQALRVRDTIITHNMRLVGKVAGRYKLPSGWERSDLLSLGCVGLIQAIERFDLSKGAQFSTFSVFWIRHAIGRALDDTAAVVRVPVHAKQAVRRADAESDEQTSKVVNDARAARYVRSLDVRMGDDSNTTLGDTIPDDTNGSVLDAMEHREELERVSAAVERLPARMQGVVRGHMAGQTLQQIGDSLPDPRSRERVRQVEAEAFRLLRADLRTA